MGTANEPSRTAAWATAAAVLAIGQLTACASMPSQPRRPAQSSYSCMQAVVRDELPVGLADKPAHCRAAGLIARYCSRTEAYLAGAGKEITDLVDGGDAEWADWRADLAGIACARRSASDAELGRCCAAKGY